MIPEITIEIAMVMANCLYSVPVTPPRNATGRNTASSTSTIEISAPAISVIACFAASSGASPFCVMFTSTFSTTTMASSTTRPIARIMPNMVSMLIEKPSRCMPTKVPTIDTGTARIGIDGRPQRLQEDEHDQHHQHHRLEEGVHHLLDRVAA